MVTGELAGRRALVTGAAGGIGQAVQAELGELGADVAGLDREPAGEPWVHRCDLTVSAQVEQAVTRAVTELGGLDILVNVAGASGRHLGDGPVDQLTDEAYRFVIDANLTSTLFVCRAALPHCGPGACVVNVSSVLGLVGGVAGCFDAHAYAAAKGGLIALTRAMAVSYAARGIRVNAVAPGLVRTPMSARAQGSPAVLAEAAARQPLVGPLLEPAQVAAAVAFLASERAGGITGVILPVDGGWTAA